MAPEDESDDGEHEEESSDFTPAKQAEEEDEEDEEEDEEEATDFTPVEKEEENDG